MRNLRLLTIVLAAVAATTGCQSGATSPLEVADPGHLTVAPTLVTIDGGTFYKLVASVRHEDGTSSKPDNVRWSSANEAIATVNTDGLVLALKAGQVQIAATWQGSRGSSTVTVQNPVRKKPTEPPSGGLN